MVFVALNTAIFVCKGWLAKAGIDYQVLLGGNLILFAVSLLTTFLSIRALRADNPHVFTRAVYTGFIVRLFVCAAAAAIYIMAAGEQLNKSGLFTSMLFYFVYTFIEVFSLQKLLKQKKNA